MAFPTDFFEKGASAVREATDRADRFARYAGGVARGLQRRVSGADAKPGMDDATLQRKVESIVFRPEGAPKDAVDVNVVDGVVYLRGRVRTPAERNSLEAAVRAIPEVRGVENLLHLPRAPARAARPQRANARKRTQRVSAERSTAAGEAKPTELAAARKGRQAAPLGSRDAEA